MISHNGAFKIKTDKVVRVVSWILISSLLSILSGCNDSSTKADETKPSSKNTQNINVTANEDAQAIVATDNAQITIGITLKEYEAGLLRQEKRLREESRSNMGKLTPEKEKTLKAELSAVQEKLLNLQQSFETTKQRLQEADQALLKLKDELPASQIDKARKLLADNNTEAAKQAFYTIEKQASPSIALAAYESGKLEEEDIHYYKAMKQYEKAVVLQENNPDYLLAAGKMARTLGDYSSARNWLEILLKQRKANNKDDVKLAEAQNELAGLYKDLGEYAKSEPLYQRSLRITEKLQGKNDPSVAMMLNNLAVLYKAQGEYAKAEPLYQRSLKISEKSLGKDHPSVATTLNNLAELYRAQGEYAKAEPLYLRDMSITEKSLGKDHPSVATTLNNLAELYRAQGEYAKAEPLYQRSLKISEKSLGKDHPSVATTLNNLAALYKAQGEYAKAEPLYQRSLKINEKLLGKDHPLVAMGLNNLAELYRAQGEYAKAEPLYLRDLSITEKSLGKDHPSVAITLYNLGYLYFSLGKKKQAIDSMQQSIDIYENKFPDGHPHLNIFRAGINHIKKQ